MVFWIIAFEDPQSVTEKLVPAIKDPKTIGTGALAFAVWAYSKTKKIFGNPLEQDLKRFVRDPRYHDKLPFAERFQDDFARILKSYVGGGRVYIFIDDLDRAEVPRAADLMQAINMLTSADRQLLAKSAESERAPANLFFVLGIDRQVIAAGIAAKSEKLTPYIASARSAAIPETGLLAKLAVDYGYEFLEKFIQVSFRIPQMDNVQVGNWVPSLTARPRERRDHPDLSRRIPRHEGTGAVQGDTATRQTRPIQTHRPTAGLPERPIRAAKLCRVMPRWWTARSQRAAPPAGIARHSQEG
jgi:hypothetical protein